MKAVLLGIAVGVGATVTMDVLGALFRRAGLPVGAKGCWVGRWYLGLARGRLAHPDIAASPEVPGEVRAALVGHYIIGIVLAVAYLVGAEALHLRPARFGVAMAYGLATCVFPWFVVHPALGFGAFGRRAPAGLGLFRVSVVNHASYGLGIWWTASLLGLD